MIEQSIAYLRGLEVCLDTVTTDPMNNGPPFYFQCGQSALRCVMTVLTARIGYAGGDRPIRTILDFGSGYGRVTRWFRAAFPDAKITVTDLNKDATLWCAEHLDAVATTDLLAEDASYDLIFLGSVFTHLPEDSIKDWFTKLTSRLAPNGVLVFTAAGRFAVRNCTRNPDRRPLRNLDKNGLAAALARYESMGFGFLPTKEGVSYGSAWAKPTWFLDAFGNRDDLIQIFFQEKAWDGSQDVYAYLKASIDATNRSNM